LFSEHEGALPRKKKSRIDPTIVEIARAIARGAARKEFERRYLPRTAEAAKQVKTDTVARSGLHSRAAPGG
jgi:hypothetical protein